MKARNQMVELFRIFLMAVVCLTHAIQFGGYRNNWVAESLKGCIVGFVFISGFYGVRFSFSKIVHLYLTGIYCTVVAVALKHFCFPTECTAGFFKSLVTTFYGNWFLHAYAVMMVFVPFFNLPFARLEKSGSAEDARGLVSMVLPYLFVTFVWAFLPSLPVVGRYLTGPKGFMIFTGMALLGIYVAARCWRLFGLCDRLGTRYAIIIAVALVPVINTFRLGSFMSPFLLAFGACVFTLVLRIPEWKGAGVVVSLFGPSAFSIYLLHSNGFGYACMRAVESRLVENCHVPVCLTWALTALLVFIGSCLLDLPRRMLMRLFWNGNLFDKLYDRMVLAFSELVCRK